MFLHDVILGRFTLGGDARLSDGVVMDRLHFCSEMIGDVVGGAAGGLQDWQMSSHVLRPPLIVFGQRKALLHPEKQ